MRLMPLILGWMMNRPWPITILAVLSTACCAQSSAARFPSQIVIATHSFIDVGPVNDSYELIQVVEAGAALRVERTLLTPEGDACFQRAKVETRSTTISIGMDRLLRGQNPCDIPDKDLRRELKRRKSGLVFSGVNVAMRVQCGGRERDLRMDVLDRDLFASAPDTPERTSWTMGVLAELDSATGPGGWDQPMFAWGDAPALPPVPDTQTVRDLRTGEFNGLFGTESFVSEIVAQADEPPPPPPSVTWSVEPATPVAAEAPKYPAIAKAAHLEGSVTVSFAIDDQGRTTSVSAVDGVKILQGAAVEAVEKWSFPEGARSRNGMATFQFKLNCLRKVRTSVN